MVRRVAILLCLVLAVAGCLHAGRRETAFSDDWAWVSRSEADFKIRKRRIGEGEWVLVGKEGHTRACVEMSEDGEPKLKLKNAKGLSGDLNVHGGDPDVRVRYKIRW